jgi:hypothetical protein
MPSWKFTKIPEIRGRKILFSHKLYRRVEQERSWGMISLEEDTLLNTTHEYNTEFRIKQTA